MFNELNITLVGCQGVLRGSKTKILFSDKVGLGCKTFQLKIIRLELPQDESIC